MDANDFEIIDGGERETLENGGTREPDKGKPDLTYLPFKALKEVALFMEEAAKKKYKKDNWKLLDTDEQKNRYLRSALRHLTSLVEGETDEDHLIACITNLLFLLWHRKR